ncbi:DUF4012 domain-containing protein [Dictyobacter formicarum]|uniref:DUF4012 domain-containing protein n=1 Tax=Dictyobacter formicarum TaxID=2778368 RepID=A0ABQ3VNL3_9CHLR|nr:DUF4012 domain-containing protein [Dictyobacter formicarum]GHO87830.1 hypothetical protein KSZ_58360 [Dictyobacter formicarum]
MPKEQKTTRIQQAVWQAKRCFQQLSQPIRIVLVVLLLFPLSLTMLASLDAFVIYSRAHSGIQHLYTIKALFSDQKGQENSLLDTARSQTVQQEMVAAHRDFFRLEQKLDNDPFISLGLGLFPQQIQSLRALSSIGIDATDIGQKALSTAYELFPTLHGAQLAHNTQPLVTQQTLDILRQGLDYVLPHMAHMRSQATQVIPTALPINSSQKQQLTSILQTLMQMHSEQLETPDLLNAIGWLLGVNEPRTILVQTMDRAELRPTGGFTGQFGELSIDHGRIAPFTLKDIGPLEEHNPDSRAQGMKAPEPFSWWPIANWGLRDANLSADFPTSARLAIKAYRHEFRKTIDGVILISPLLITSALEILGPITIPLYNETITAQNLEERLHYYQLDNQGILKEVIIEKVKQTPQDPQIAGNQARKLFTRRLSNALLERLRHASLNEIILLSGEMLHTLKTRDLQIYVNNPQIQRLMISYGSSGEIDRSSEHDGLFVVQANLSTSKASQYVRTNIQDTVTLDAQGGATHLLKLRLIYTQIGPVYGFDTYRDYVRIYVPPGSKLLWGNGFDAGYAHALCGTNGYPVCPQYNIYGDGTLMCPPNMTQSGFATWILNDPYYSELHPMNRIAPPTNMESDEPGRAMFGGWVIVPKNCNMTVALSWYVPPAGHHPYRLLIQRQASTRPEVDLTIQPTTEGCKALHTTGMHFQGVMGGEDMRFTPPPLPAREGCSMPSRA